MTHEELIMRLWEKRNSLCDNLDIHFALSAVVELHKPALDSEMDENSDNETLGCAGCGFDFNYGTWEVNYPCRTIQAIEKELS